MASIVINGDTSGGITLSAPAVAGSNTQTLVAATGTLAPLVSETAKSATGTSVDFTGIPSWVKRITVIFSGVSTSGTSGFGIRIGSSSGVESTGYQSTSVRTASSLATVTSTTEFNFASALAADVISGSASLSLIGASTWVIDGLVSWSSGVVMTAGSKTITGTMSVVSVVALGGSTFDAGTINILYE